MNFWNFKDSPTQRFCRVPCAVLERAAFRQRSASYKTEFQKKAPHLKASTLTAFPALSAYFLVEVTIIIIFRQCAADEVKWHLFIYWFSIPVLEHKIINRETPSVTHPSHTNMIKRTFSRAPVIF